MMSNSSKRETVFLKRFMFSMGVFIFFLAVQTFAIELWNLAPWMVVAVTLLPVTPLIWAFFIYRSHFRAMDEYLQRLTGEAFLWVIGIVCFGTFTYGMLAMKIPMPEFNITFILPFVFGGHGLILQILLMEKKDGK